MVFAVRYRIDTLEFFFHSSIPGLSVPLSTLRLQPLDCRCKTRGQDGSLLLSWQTLSFLTSCRFIPAHNEANLLHLESGWRDLPIPKRIIPRPESTRIVSC